LSGGGGRGKRSTIGKTGTSSALSQLLKTRKLENVMRMIIRFNAGREEKVDEFDITSEYTIRICISTTQMGVISIGQLITACDRLISRNNFVAYDGLTCKTSVWRPYKQK
jgi:hypothetical protein